MVRQDPRKPFAQLTLKEQKERLAQYSKLMKEIDEDRLRLARLADRLLRHDPVNGFWMGDGRRCFSGYEARINENVARCAALVEELQAFINGIEDSEMRRIFTLRYVHGFTWQRIAFRLQAYDESYPRKKHDRYLEKRARAAAEMLAGEGETPPAEAPLIPAEEALADADMS